MSKTQNVSIYREDLRIALNTSVSFESLKGSSVLITGVTGTIGSFIIDLFCLANREQSAGITVYAAGRRTEELQKRFGSSPGVTCVPYDMMLPLSFNYDVDYIIHAAGNSHPDAFSLTPVETLLSCVQGTNALLKYARKHRTKRLLYVSSGEVYGQGTASVEAFKEDEGGYIDPVSPRSCYPNGKRAAETLCASYAKEYGVNSVVVRPCHTYGPTVLKTDSRAHAQFFRNALRGENIVLKSAGTQMRSYCYVADCASALLTVLTSGMTGQAYNLANPEERLTIASFARMVAHAAGVDVVFESPTEADFAGRTFITRQVLDTHKLESLGWHGAFSTSRGVMHTLSLMQNKIRR